MSQVVSGSLLAAEATTQGAGKPGGGSALTGMLVPLGIIFVVMYLFIFAPQRKKEKRRRAMLEAINKGDEVVTIGGVHGTVWQVKDQEVVLDLGNDIKMTFSRGSIARVGEEEPDKK